jgi:drug/metabolite transporter (DMT)-like permease
MKPDSSNFAEEELPPPSAVAEASSSSDASPRLSPPAASPMPLEQLQQRYADLLSEDIQRLEALKSNLQSEIEGLRRDRTQLRADIAASSSAEPAPDVLSDDVLSDDVLSDDVLSDLQTLDAQTTQAATDASSVDSTHGLSATSAEAKPVLPAKIIRRGPQAVKGRGPRLPGEPDPIDLNSQDIAETKSAEPASIAAAKADADSSIQIAFATEADDLAADSLRTDENVTKKAAEEAIADGPMAEAKAAEPKVALSIPWPRLPGEPPVPASAKPSAQSAGKPFLNSTAETGAATEDDGPRSIELPIPATSEQRRRRNSDEQQSMAALTLSERNSFRKGLLLSAIAMGLMAWQFCLVGVLAKGGSWLGIPIGQLGGGFVPAVALLWLRMVVMLPALVVLAPQLYARTWPDLQDWLYRDRLITLLMVSGTALFLAEALIYRCIGALGAALGAVLFFLYPLTAVPLGWFWGQGRRRTSLSWMALVAIAMGGVLTLKPSIPLEGLAIAALTPTTIGLGLFASLAFSLYVVVTNQCYRQYQCHPIPVGIVQFSTVAVLSSFVLIIQPLKPVAISWLSLALWGLLIGIAMLLAYLLSYSSLRLVGPHTAMIAAAAPLVTLLLAGSFSPTPKLAILQWTGILLVTLGGVALGKENSAG